MCQILSAPNASTNTSIPCCFKLLTPTNLTYHYYPPLYFYCTILSALFSFLLFTNTLKPPPSGGALGGTITSLLDY